MPKPDLEELQKSAIALIKDAGEAVKEIVSIGPSSKGTTVVVFINDADEELGAEISDASTRIFELGD